VPDGVYANDDYYGQQSMTGSGGHGSSPYGEAIRPEGEPESHPAPEPVSPAHPDSEPVDSGMLMSFLTDFRTAQHEEIRRERMEQLEKTRKGRAHRPLPRPEEPEDDSTYEETYSEECADTYGDPAGPQSPEEDPGAAGPETQYGISDADFQVAACQPQEPAPRKRFGLGLPGLRNLGQSPATA
jgi:hypothetical protein